MTYKPEVSGAKGDDLVSEQREKYLVSLNACPLLCKENVRYFTIHEYLRTHSCTPGPDGITNKILQIVDLDDNFLIVLTQDMNVCWEHGQIKHWKIAKVVTIPKPDKKASVRKFKADISHIMSRVACTTRNFRHIKKITYFHTL